MYNTNHGQYYYGSDLLGSVKFVTGQGGQELKRIEYDVFGGIYKGNSPYGLETGYTGKPYDAVTGLSDYGFRDYSPTHARFITEDPIRDGENWFSYVGNNPVNWVDPDGRIAVTTVATGFGVLYVGYKYATDAQLREDTGELIKASVKATVDTVKWTGKTVAKGAQWAGEKISEGVSAAKAYFSKGKNKKTKNNSQEGTQENRKTQEEKDKELQDMKKNHPTHPDYKPPKNWNGRKVKTGRGYGWPAKNGDVWVPDAHAEGSHSPHWDVQHPDGTYDPVYPVSSNTQCSTK